MCANYELILDHISRFRVKMLAQVMSSAIYKMRKVSSSCLKSQRQILNDFLVPCIWVYLHSKCAHIGCLSYSVYVAKAQYTTASLNLPTHAVWVVYNTRFCERTTKAEAGSSSKYGQCYRNCEKEPRVYTTIV